MINRLILEFSFLQVEHKPLHKAIHHENHVSQMTKSIQSQANHVSSHMAHNQSHNQSNFNHVNDHEGHTSASRISNHVSTGNQINNVHHQKNQMNKNAENQEWRHQEETGRSQEESIYESGPVVNDGKHSLLQYAMLNFRQSTEK